MNPWRTHTREHCVEIREGAFRLLALPEFAPACEGALRSGQIPRSFEVPGARGGAGLPIAIDGLAQPLHLRRLQHGGALGGLLGERFLGIGRAAQELEVNRRLQQTGAPVPTPVCAVERRRSGLSGSQVALGTFYEDAAENGIEFLARASGDDERFRVCREAGQAIRRFHDAGGHHADLHLGNLLITQRADPILVIDLDRCLFAGAPSAPRRMRELMRLRRSVTKRGLEARIGQAGLRLVFEGYVGADEPLRRELLRCLGRERLRTRLHAWRYPASRPVE